MAIFMCASDCERFEKKNTIPDIVRNRLVSFRAFACDGMMIYDIVDGGDYDAAVLRIFSRDDVAYVNAHTAKAGCMLCHIERARTRLPRNRVSGLAHRAVIRCRSAAQRSNLTWNLCLAFFGSRNNQPPANDC
jgi:hypothetical protein